MKKLAIPAFLLPLIVAACGSSNVATRTPAANDKTADADGSTLVSYVSSGGIALKDLTNVKEVQSGRQLSAAEFQNLLKEQDKRVTPQVTTGAVTCNTGAALRKAFPSGRYYTRLIADCPGNVTVTFNAGYAYIFYPVTGENARAELAGRTTSSFWVDSGVITRRQGYYEARGVVAADVNFYVGGTQYTGRASYNEPGLQLYGDGN